MLVYIAIILSFISITLSIIAIIHFNKKCSSENISNEIASHVEKFINTINRNAHMDLELINDSTKRIKALINEADIKMDNFREASNMLRNMIAEVEKINKKSGTAPVYIETKKLDNIYPVGYEKNESKKIDPNASYSVNKLPVQQASLFDEPETEVSKSILKDETNVMPDGTAYKEVPLIITKVFDDKKVNTSSNKEIKEKVEKLFRQGMQSDEIAKELSCPLFEVEFIIDMLTVR